MAATCDGVTPLRETGQGMRGKYQMCHSPKAHNCNWVAWVAQNLPTLGRHFRDVGGPHTGQVGIRTFDATKPFIPQHKRKMAPERLWQVAHGGVRVCVFLKKHPRERENATAPRIGTDGTGGAVRQRREGQKSTSHKKAQAFAASSKSD